MVAGGPFGTGVAGGVSMIFGDQLSDRQIFAAIQANGTVKDIGGALQYYNMKNRWNYGVGVEHIPYLTGQVYLQDTTISTRTGSSVAAYSVNQLLQRVYIDQAAVFTQYPFSMTKRLEFTANITHYGFDTELFKTTFVGNTIVDQNGREADIDLQADLVRRTVARARRRQLVRGIHVAGTGRAISHSGHADVRSVTYQTALLDYRQYYFLRPFTLAFRGMSLGRYGSGAEDPNTTWPIYLGEETLIRGYGYGSFTSDECQVDNPPANTQTAQVGCPAFQRLFGSKAAVGQHGVPHSAVRHGRIRPDQLPLPADGGLAVLRRRRLVHELSEPGLPVRDERRTPSRRSARRRPTSTKSQIQQLRTIRAPIAFRCSAPACRSGSTCMGYAIIEAYVAHPFQRPQKNWVWGFQLAPGW